MRLEMIIYSFRYSVHNGHLNTVVFHLFRCPSDLASCKDLDMANATCFKLLLNGYYNLCKALIQRQLWRRRGAFKYETQIRMKTTNTLNCMKMVQNHCTRLLVPSSVPGSWKHAKHTQYLKLELRVVDRFSCQKTSRDSPGMAGAETAIHTVQLP